MNKLQVLKQYLQYVIDNKDNHYWHSIHSCHCGLLLKSLEIDECSIDSSEDLFDLDFTLHNVDTYHYRKVFSAYKNSNNCFVTNLKFTEVVDKLVVLGLTLQELIDLEHLQDKRFLDIDINDYKSIKLVDNLILYLTNWINYEQQLVKVKEVNTVTVSI